MMREFSVVPRNDESVPENALNGMLLKYDALIATVEKMQREIAA